MNQSGESASASQEDLAAVDKLKTAYSRLRQELAKVIVGQDTVVEQLLISIFAQGHCLLEGVPGLAKTLIVSTLAKSLNLNFKRIQFTPDLMPSDVTGTEVLQEDKSSGARVFRFLQGPIFANIVLADEINRTPPKTQAAMLESMQERQVTIGGTRHALPSPFFVLATQNPIEQEGTYTLPEAQQDRFMFKVFVDYPSYDEEYLIAETTTSAHSQTVEQVLSGEEIEALQKSVRRVPVAPHVIHYALRLIRATRVGAKDANVPTFVRDNVSWGAGPRGLQYLLLGGKARAMLHGRFAVGVDDIRAVALPVLRHRVITNFSAESEGITSDDVIRRLLQDLPESAEGDRVPAKLQAALNA
ncbi:MAG: MoxR family ATPase [Planctomycetaceae bacterium]|nr:MoxR family ATPase [Planctomycetaceae bacterium]